MRGRGERRVQRLPLHADAPQLVHDEVGVLGRDVHQRMPLADVDTAHDACREPRDPRDLAHDVAGLNEILATDVEEECGESLLASGPAARRRRGRAKGGRGRAATRARGRAGGRGSGAVAAR